MGDYLPSRVEQATLETLAALEGTIARVPFLEDFEIVILAFAALVTIEHGFAGRNAHVKNHRLLWCLHLTPITFPLLLTTLLLTTLLLTFLCSPFATKRNAMKRNAT